MCIFTNPHTWYKGKIILCRQFCILHFSLNIVLWIFQNPILFSRTQVFFYGSPHSIWKFLGQRLNSSHCCGSTKSFNLHWARGLNLHLHSDLSLFSLILNILCYRGNSWNTIFNSLHRIIIVKLP